MTLTDVHVRNIYDAIELAIDALATPGVRLNAIKSLLVARYLADVLRAARGEDMGCAATSLCHARRAIQSEKPRNPVSDYIKSSLTGAFNAGWVREDFGGRNGWSRENMGNLDAPFHIAGGGMEVRSDGLAAPIIISREGRPS